MLLPQIKSAVRKFSIPEFKLNFGVVGGTFRDDKSNIYNLIDNLREVESYIRKKENVKVIGENGLRGDWISGDCSCYTITLEDNSAVVLFIGEYKDTIFALGGSSKHLIGNSDCNSINIGWSFLPNLLRALNAFNEFEGKLSNDIYTPLSEEPRQWYETIKLSLRKCSQSSLPVSKLDFLARVLLSGEEEEKRFLLATPLYISVST